MRRLSQGVLRLKTCMIYKSWVLHVSANAQQASSKAIGNFSEISRQSKNEDGLPSPDLKTLQSLNELATAKLSEIVRRSAAREAGWEGYDTAELIAAQELLDRDAAEIIR